MCDDRFNLKTTSLERSSDFFTIGRCKPPFKYFQADPDESVQLVDDTAFIFEELPYSVKTRFIELLSPSSLRRFSFTNKDFYRLCLMKRGVPVENLWIEKKRKMSRASCYKNGKLFFRLGHMKKSRTNFLKYFRIEKLIAHNSVPCTLSVKNYHTLIFSADTPREVDLFVTRWLHPGVINVQVKIGSDRERDYRWSDFAQVVKRCFHHFKASNVRRVDLCLDFALYLDELKRFIEALQELLSTGQYNSFKWAMTCYTPHPVSDYEVGIAFAFHEKKFWIYVCDDETREKYYSSNLEILFSEQYFKMCNFKH